MPSLNVKDPRMRRPSFAVPQTWRVIISASLCSLIESDISDIFRIVRSFRQPDGLDRWLTIVAGLLLASPVQAGSLTLGCSGTLMTTHVPREGVAGDPEKENIVDFSVVIDFDQRTVSGFWAWGPLPII